MRGRGVVAAGKGITLVVSNEDMDDIIRIIKSLENSGILIDEIQLQTYSLGHNILGLYNILVQIQLTTSKTKRDV